MLSGTHSAGLKEFISMSESVAMLQRQKNKFDKDIEEKLKLIETAEKKIKETSDLLNEHQVKQARATQAWKAFNELLAKRQELQCGECVIQCGRQATHVMPHCGHVCACSECVERLLEQPQPSCPTVENLLQAAFQSKYTFSNIINRLWYAFYWLLNRSYFVIHILSFIFLFFSFLV